MTKPTELWWASVGGNRCEPIRVSADHKRFYSIGCEDFHPMEGVVLVKQILEDAIPLNPAESEAERKKRARQFKNLSIGLGYRDFRTPSSTRDTVHG